MTPCSATDVARLIATLEAIERASAEMLGAARTRDWDRFRTTQAHCATLIDEARDLGEGLALARDDLRRKLRIFRRIVRNEAQIRRLARPVTERYEWLLQGRIPGSGLVFST